MNWKLFKNYKLKITNLFGQTCVDRPAVRFFNYACDADKYVGTPEGDWPNYVYKVNKIDTEFGTTGWQDLIIKKGKKADSLVCVYQPRVQVLDNWGWCSGECGLSGGAPTRKGCYNKDGPFTVQACNNSDDDNNTTQNRWVEFSNIVVIAPAT